MLLEEGDALLRGAHSCGHAEHAADAGSDDVGVIQIGQRIANDEGIDTCCLGRAEDGAQIAGLLNTFQNNTDFKSFGLY